MKKRILIALLVGSALLLALEGVGFYFNLMHNEFFFAEMPVIAFSSSVVLGVVGWVLGRVLSRPPDYYKNVREQPHLIEARQEDWVE